MSPDIRNTDADDREVAIPGLTVTVSADLIARYGSTFFIRKDAVGDIYVLTEDE